MFLLAGEVILGGKQDRIIGQNTIIAANTTQSVPVFCVEHGRWTEQESGTVFHSAHALAHGRLRGKAAIAAAKTTGSGPGPQRTTPTTWSRAMPPGRERIAAGSPGEQQIDAAVRLDVDDKMKMIGYVSR